MLASGSTDCQPNHHGLMELFDCLCCQHSFLTFKISSFSIQKNAPFLHARACTHCSMNSAMHSNLVIMYVHSHRAYRDGGISR